MRVYQVRYRSDSHPFLIAGYKGESIVPNGRLYPCWYGFLRWGRICKAYNK